MIDKENYLLDDVSWVFSPNHGDIIFPKIIVIHHSGTNSFHDTICNFCDPNSNTSSHIVIAKTGKIWQLVPFNLEAFHLEPECRYKEYKNINKCSIGITNVGIGDEYPVAQIRSNIYVINCIKKIYDIDIVGHDSISFPPGTANDPGPDFPWEWVIRDIIS